MLRILRNVNTKPWSILPRSLHMEEQRSGKVCNRSWTVGEHSRLFAAAALSCLAVNAKEDDEKATAANKKKINAQNELAGRRSSTSTNQSEAELVEKLEDKIANKIATQALEQYKKEKLKSEEEMRLESEIEKFEVNADDIKTRFGDVVGNDALIDELKHIVKFMKDPEKYFNMGATLPSGCLISGPHGVGKTLIARAMAGECGVLFYSTKGVDFADGSDGVERLRNLFKIAQLKKPCIIFIDDIDYLSDDCKELLNHLLDGFDQSYGLFVLATATNRGYPDAWERPGRFDIKAVIPMQDKQTRLRLIEMYVKKKSISFVRAVDIEKLAQESFSLTGAQIVGILNHATISAVTDGRNKINSHDIYSATEKVREGLVNILMDKKSKLQVAYHEAGHALVHYYLGEESGKVQKLTIVPRGDSLGRTDIAWEDNMAYKLLREEMIMDIKALFGGRVAEELVYGRDKVGAGAHSDIVRATGTARRMVKDYGLSDAIGLRYIDESAVASDELQRKVDNEISKILAECHEEVKDLLSQKRAELEKVANKLAEKEELSYEEMKSILETTG